MPANTGVAGASHLTGFFAGTPAPTQVPRSTTQTLGLCYLHSIQR